MILTLLINKLKSFFLVFINLFRRALCCFRRRKLSNCEAVPLTHVVSSSESEDANRLHGWGDWGDENNLAEPRTVQDHIEIYRKRKAQVIRESPEPVNAEEQLNFFEDMTPKITTQTKIFLNTKQMNDTTNNLNRLNFAEDALQAVPSTELTEWEENSGWEGENLENDAQRILREQKRLERERRVWEQHQRRQEKINRLGSKLSTMFSVK